MPDLNEFISTEETAEKLKYHVEHVRRMLREGSIAVLKIGPAAARHWTAT
jgi:excisionase family DNA binding protein